jgi:ParB/RepB/Spo0J family partition protein
MTTAQTLVEVNSFPGLHCHHFKSFIDDEAICKGLTVDIGTNEDCLKKKCQSIWKACPACLDQGEQKRIGHRPEICCEPGRNLCEFHETFGIKEKRSQGDVAVILKSKPVFMFPLDVAEKITKKSEKNVTQNESVIEEIIGNIFRVKRSRILPFKNQPRKHFSQARLQDLANSILEIGQRTPIEVKRIFDNPDYDWELIDGERRYLACGIAGVEDMKAVLGEPKDEKNQYLLSVVANFCREGHTPIEIALSIKKIKEDFGYSEEKIAKIFGKSGAWVNLHYKLLDLHPKVQDMLNPDLPKNQQIGISVAIYVATQTKDHTKQIMLVDQIMKKGMKTKQAFAHVRAETNEANEELRKQGKLRKRKPSDDYKILETLVDRTIGDFKLQLKLGDEKIQKFFEHRPYDDREKITDRLTQIIADAQKMKQIINDMV